jgi:hypothetical protein
MLPAAIKTSTWLWNFLQYSQPFPRSAETLPRVSPLDKTLTLNRDPAALFPAPSGAIPSERVKIVVRSQPEEDIGRPRQRVTDILFGRNFLLLCGKGNRPSGLP